MHAKSHALEVNRETAGRHDTARPPAIVTAAAASLPQLSIVIPVFNETDNIGELLDELSAALAVGPRWEAIVVDDGSTDDTLRKLLDYRDASAVRLRVLTHCRNLGQSAALYHGVQAAAAPWIATLDGDGQNDPRDILKLWNCLHDAERRPSLLCGHRTRRRDSFLKRLSSRVANAVRGRVLGDNTPDTGCGLKLFQRRVFQQLPAFDHMHRFLPALVQRHGGLVESVPVNHRQRLRGESKYGVFDRLWVGVVDLFGVLWLRRRGWLDTVQEMRR